MIQFHKERMDRCKNERKDGQIIFFRTLLATASGLKTFLIITGRSYVLGCCIVVFVLGQKEIADCLTQYQCASAEANNIPDTISKCFKLNLQRNIFKQNSYQQITFANLVIVPCRYLACYLYNRIQRSISLSYLMIAKSCQKNFFLVSKYVKRSLLFFLKENTQNVQ